MYHGIKLKFEFKDKFFNAKIFYQGSILYIKVFNLNILNDLSFWFTFRIKRSFDIKY